MMFTKIKYKSFSFPINKHIVLSKKIFSSKEVILLKALDSIGNTMFAEISPLPGFSKETITDCKIQLDDLLCRKIKFPIKSDELNETLKKTFLFPSIRFAFEQILLNKKIREEKNYINVNNKKFIETNALVSLSEKKNIIEKIDGQIKNGFGTIKLKAGINNFNDELKTIKIISGEFKDKIKLRLDINGNWNYEEAKKNIEALAKFNIEYIEQPVKRKEDLIKLAETSKINLTPDESIENYADAIDFIEAGKLNFLVLKPTIRIGIFDTIKIIELANKKNINVIITSAFETAIGRSTLVFLASLTRHNFAHGLGLEILGENSIPFPFKIEKAKIKFEIKNFPPNFMLDF